MTTAVTLAQDLETGDLAFDERGIRLAYGADAVVVLLSNALRQRPGDDILRPSRGIPLETILGKNPSPAALDGLFRRRAAEVRVVKSVVYCKTTRDDETLSTDLRVRTDEGEVSAEVTVS